MNTQYIELSASMSTLIRELSSECHCVRILQRAIARVNNRGKSYLLAHKLFGNYFTFREQEGLITYCPAGREQALNEDGRWERKGRQGIKPARFIREMLHPRLIRRLKEHDIASFAEKFSARELEAKIKIEFALFKDGYNPECCIEGLESCMTGQPVSEFYNALPCRLLVARNGVGKIAGRGIVWDCEDCDGAKYKVLDRVYYVAPWVREAMISHAREQKWYWKNGGSATRFCNPDGKEIVMHLRVTSKLRLEDLAFYPYMDTFATMASNWKSLRNNVDLAQLECGEALLRDTGGRYESPSEHDGEVRTCDGEWIPEDEAVYIGDEVYRGEDRRIAHCVRCCEWHMRDEMTKFYHGSRWQRICNEYVEDSPDGECGEQMFFIHLSRSNYITLEAQYVIQ